MNIHIGKQLGFGEQPPLQGEEAERLPLPDAEVYFYRVFFSAAESDRFLTELLEKTPWKQEQIRWYGKLINLPRLTAWYGDAGKVYKYSGITVEPNAWTDSLLKIKALIEAATGVVFNSVLLNLYRDGRDSVAWHSDNEAELGPQPVIGSVSFGETRPFNFRHKKTPSLRAKVELSHGSYLLMKGPTQDCWVHEIPKTSRKVRERINLTFRTIVDVTPAGPNVRTHPQ